MLAWLASMFSGGILQALTGQLQQAWATYEAGQTAEARAAAQVEVQRIQGLIDAQQQAAHIRLATVGQWEMRLLVFLAALGPVVHYLAVCVVSTWPARFPGWVVLALPAPMDQWEGSIILSFFGLSVVGSIAKAIAWRRS